jgi:hypothetical protein
MHRMCIIQGLSSIYVQDVVYFTLLYCMYKEVQAAFEGPQQAAQDGCFRLRKRGREPNIYACVCVAGATERRRGA